MQVSRFLKLVLTADALSCLGMGALLTAAAAPLSGLFGLSHDVVFGAGAVLLPIGLFILVIATRRNVTPLFIYTIIAGNVLWVADSLILAGSAPTITAIGTAFVLVQAAAVTVLTVLETVGLARVQRAVADDA